MPDMIVCRSEEILADEIKDKIALFCSVKKDLVIDEADVEMSIYEVPLKLHEQRIDEKICELLHLPKKEARLEAWKELIEQMRNPKGRVVIGIVGKYLQLHDAYKSVFEALQHAALFHRVSLEIRCFESDKVESFDDLEACDGYFVPGGFGERGWMGKILAAKYCREKKIPYFGLCLGMQVMCVEFARHVLKLFDANSTEMDPKTPHPIICLLSEQKELVELGGTMRLGAYPCNLMAGSKAEKAYGSNLITERHRHRFEFNNAFKSECEKAGLIISGTLHNHTLCEVVEVKDHPWMVGVQFHPEFNSKPDAPHPLFRDFIGAALK